jgi:hypothetical protein
MSGGLTGPGCEGWYMSARDIWAEGVWYSRLTVVMRDGEILRTRWHAVYID